MKNRWFVDFSESITTSAMAFGYDCGTGWYPLIEELFDKIEELIDTKYPELKTGEFKFKVLQVKEKFGELRVYVTAVPDEILDLIDSYTDKSLKTCERCGQPGRLTSDHGWYTTLCRECIDKRIESQGKQVCNHQWERIEVEKGRKPIDKCTFCGIIEY